MTALSSPSPSLEFAPPGPGSWLIDAVHQPRPASRFHCELFPEPFMRGFQASTRKYGLLFDYNEVRFVNGFWYYLPRFVGEDEFAERLRTVPTVFQRRLWRKDLAEWDSTAKPAAVRANLELQRVDPAGLPTVPLLEHIDRCRRHLERMVYEHMRFTVAGALPVGDFLVQGAELTRLSTPELLTLLRGTAPVSAGKSPQLDRLARLIRGDRTARSLLGSDADAGDVLSALRDLPGAVGRAASAYLELASYRLVDGLDVGEPYGLEEPGVILGAVKSGLGRPRDSGSAQARRDAARALVARGQRGRFDALLAEARHNYRLREERGMFTDVWASGITRRAILAAGERLVARDAIVRASDLVEATYSELRSLLAGGDGPSRDELRARALYRETTAAADAPARLGPEPGPPPPLDGLPAEELRALRAMETYVGALFTESGAQSEAGCVHGQPAGGGVLEGVARVMTGPLRLDGLPAGSVLVARSCSEAISVLAPSLGALVTDHGGVLSHAAIVAREYGIPCVVGTREATALIPDGARVRVDGDRGEVNLL